MNITIRNAERGDCALLLKFIKALAEYERMSDAVCATEKNLEEWLFDKRAAEAVFAVVDGREAGFALFFHNFSTFQGRAGLYLEDVFVLPEYRGRGVGTAIMRELARIAVERGYGRFEWSCLDWNAPGIAFYKSIGAERMEEWTVYRLSGESLDKLASQANR